MKSEEEGDGSSKLSLQLEKILKQSPISCFVHRTVGDVVCNSVNLISLAFSRLTFLGTKKNTQKENHVLKRNPIPPLLMTANLLYTLTKLNEICCKLLTYSYDVFGKLTLFGSFAQAFIQLFPNLGFAKKNFPASLSSSPPPPPRER